MQVVGNGDDDAARSEIPLIVTELLKEGRGPKKGGFNLRPCCLNLSHIDLGEVRDLEPDVEPGDGQRRFQDEILGEGELTPTVSVELSYERADLFSCVEFLPLVRR